MATYKIFAGSSHPTLAENICKNLNLDLGQIVNKQFSCGERYLRFSETIRGQNIFLIQTGRTNLMDNDFVELLLMIDAARRSFAKSIHVIIPYYAYSRQDKIHDAREGISAKLFGNLFSSTGADHLISMHLHSDQIQGFFDIPTDNINPIKLFTNHFKKKNIDAPVIVSPDAGGAKYAKKFANEMGCPFAIMHKSRPEHNKAEITHVIGDVKGRTPIIVDDMIDTGGSVCKAKEALINQGANNEVYLTATHAIFSGNSRENLSQANFKEIVCTDTLPVDNPPKNFISISTSQIFAEIITNVMENQSVSKLHLM